MCLVTINAILVPIDFGFEPELFQHVLMKNFNSVIDFFFFADIVISFHTTYIDHLMGFEVWEKKKIAIHYLKNSFTIDLLATIPFDTIG